MQGYELIEVVGRGGMGVVWKARQDGLDRTVAVKTINAAEFSTQRQRLRFRAEALAASTLDHPGIVPIYDVGEDHGELFYAMAYLEGGSLDARAAGPAEDVWLVVTPGRPHCCARSCWC